MERSDVTDLVVNLNWVEVPGLKACVIRDVYVIAYLQLLLMFLFLPVSTSSRNHLTATKTKRHQEKQKSPLVAYFYLLESKFRLKFMIQLLGIKLVC